ncbi:MAG: hypothetical protein AAFZ07_24060 [Actinomycetota bacterium]
MSHAPAHLLTGLDLRYVLTTTLVEHGRTMTVDELSRSLLASGFTLAGRPSKTISDSLRWEVRRGRVVRLGRGRYGAREMPKSTRHRLRERTRARRRAACAPTWQRSA